MIFSLFAIIFVLSSESFASAQGTCPESIDVILTIDRSGSMGYTFINNTPLMTIAKDAATYFVDFINSPEYNIPQVGVVSFGTSATLNLGLTSNLEEVKTSIKSLNANGETPMSQGIKLSQKEISENGRPNAEHIIILLSDGIPNPYNPLEVKKEADNAKAEGTIIYVILIGTFDQMYIDLMNQSIASSPDNFYHITREEISYELLKNVYEEIARLYSCNYCSNEGQIIMKLSDFIGTRGEVWDGTGDYPVEICYDSIFGEEGTRGFYTIENKILGLSSQSNALAQIPSLSTYGTNVFYGDLACTSRTGACIDDEKCVVTLSGDSDALLATCDSPTPYNTKICCTPSYCGDGIINRDLEQCDGTDLDSKTCSNLLPNSIGTLFCNNDCSFNLSNCILPASNLYWADSDLTPISKINEVKLGETEIFMVFNNIALAVGETLAFQIYREDGTNTYPVRVGAGSISATVSSSGAIVTDWTPSVEDITNAGGTDDFYFNVVYRGITEKSNLLDVLLFENPPEWEIGIEIGKCLKNEVMEGECVNEDSVITISQEATWNWGEKNTFSNEEDCKAFVQSVRINGGCAESNGSWHYDPRSESLKCVDRSWELKCLDILKLPFFGIKEFLITLFAIFGIYAFLIKRK